MQEHPSLVQAASYIAAAIAKEGGEGRLSTRNLSRLVGDSYDSDDELRGMDPGVRCHDLCAVTSRMLCKQNLLDKVNYYAVIRNACVAVKVPQINSLVFIIYISIQSQRGKKLIQEVKSLLHNCEI